MRPLLYVLSALAVMGLAFWAYRQNYATQKSIKEVARLQRQIGQLREDLSMQQAEWAYENRPARLRELALLNFDMLGLLPMTPEQFGSVSEIELAPEKSAAAPVGAPAAASASVTATATMPVTTPVDASAQVAAPAPPAPAAPAAPAKPATPSAKIVKAAPPSPPTPKLTDTSVRRLAVASAQTAKPVPAAKTTHFKTWASISGGSK